MNEILRARIAMDCSRLSPESVSVYNSVRNDALERSKRSFSHDLGHDVAVVVFVLLAGILVGYAFFVGLGPLICIGMAIAAIAVTLSMMGGDNIPAMIAASIHADALRAATAVREKRKKSSFENSARSSSLVSPSVISSSAISSSAMRRNTRGEKGYVGDGESGGSANRAHRSRTGSRTNPVVLEGQWKRLSKTSFERN